MKSWKTLAIFGIVLVVLIGVLIGVKQLVPSTSAPTPTPAPAPAPLVDVVVGDVYTATVENATGLVSFMTNESTATDGTKTYTWTVADPAGSYYDASSIASAAGSLLNFSVAQEVAANASDLSAFGLADPKVKVTLRMKDGSKHVVAFGDAAPLGAGYYATVDDTHRIVVVSSSTYSYTQTGVLNLLSTSLPINGVTADNLLSLDLTRQDGQLISFTLDGTGDSKVWNVKTPVAAAADTTRLDPLIAALVAIKPSAYVELNPGDLSKYGLDKPRYTIVLRSSTGDVTIRIGIDAGSGDAYFMSSAIPAVFKYTVSSLTNIDTSTVNMISKLVYLANIWDISKVDVSIDGLHIATTLDVLQSGDAKSGKFTVNGKDASIIDGDGNSYFRAFYVATLSMIVDRIDTAAKPVDTADVRIVYTKKADGSTVTLDFAKTDNGSYYIFRNGVYTGFLNKSTDFYGTDPTDLGLVPTYNKMLDAMKNAVDGIYATPTPVPTSGG